MSARDPRDLVQDIGLQNEDWEVFERNDHVGGLASSYADELGVIWDHGGYVMFSRYSYFDELKRRPIWGLALRDREHRSFGDAGS